MGKSSTKKVVSLISLFAVLAIAGVIIFFMVHHTTKVVSAVGEGTTQFIQSPSGQKLIDLGTTKLKNMRMAQKAKSTPAPPTPESLPDPSLDIFKGAAPPPAPLSYSDVFEGAAPPPPPLSANI